jgi:two-component system nitrate/nitrite response regulator NarL
MTDTIRILLVDDHKTMLWGLERLIDTPENLMTVVGTASDCAGAVAQAALLEPDIIVLDLDLGGESSLNILPALLASGESRVLIFTGTTEQSMLDLAMFKGARGVIGKEAPTEQLLQAIRKVHRGELWLKPELLERMLSAYMNPVNPVNPLPALSHAHAMNPPHRASPADLINPVNPVNPGAAVPANASATNDRIATLTAKERKVVQTVVEGSGALTRVLAKKLFISEHTLRNHLTSIYHKLGVANRIELYVYATRHELGNPGN